MANSAQQPPYLRYLAIIATITACCMYISYIPQIMDNLAGNKTSPIQPAAAAINCTLWVWYGLVIKDKAIAIANFPGVVFGIIACLTAF